MQDVVRWWYYVSKAWFTRSPRDALEITKGMIVGKGSWEVSSTRSFSGYYYSRFHLYSGYFFFYLFCFLSSGLLLSRNRTASSKATEEDMSSLDENAL